MNDDPITEAEYDEVIERCNRIFHALQNVLPSYHRHLLWLRYTLDRPSIESKFQAWIESDKNPREPYDPQAMFREIGLQDGDWVKREEQAA